MFFGNSQVLSYSLGVLRVLSCLSKVTQFLRLGVVQSAEVLVIRLPKDQAFLVYEVSSLRFSFIHLFSDEVAYDDWNRFRVFLLLNNF